MRVRDDRDFTVSFVQKLAVRCHHFILEEEVTRSLTSFRASKVYCC